MAKHRLQCVTEALFTAVHSCGARRGCTHDTINATLPDVLQDKKSSVVITPTSGERYLSTGFV